MMSTEDQSGADGIEIYTGTYAAAFRAGDATAELAACAATAARAAALGLVVNAGHDLNLDNLPGLVAAMPHLAEASIGHELTADALAGLALLLTRPVNEAGEYFEVRRAGEILRVVEAFLKHHFQRFQGLRSLEMLRALPPERSGGGRPDVDRTLGGGAACAT